MHLPPLGSLFENRVVCFQQFTASFGKKGGSVGVCASVLQFDLFPLCFHNVMNPFSRNPFLFTSIQIPQGVPFP